MTMAPERPLVEDQTSPGERMTARQRLNLVLVLGFLIALGPLTIDMYLPALPTITDDLQTTAAAVQLTLTGTLAGLALGQLLIGPVSDAVGRRVPLLFGVGVHILASVLCVIAPNLATLGTLRVLQGLGAAAAAVVATAIVRDLFTGLAAAKLFSRLMLVMGAAPILAPTLGGIVLGWTSWRGVFVVLAVLGVAILTVTAVALPETLPAERRRNGGVLGTVRDYGRLFTDRAYIGLILVAGLSMAALFAYVAGSSFVFQEQYGLSEQQFGFVFGAGAVGLITATQLNVRLLRRWTPSQILMSALGFGAVAGLVAAAVRGDRLRRHRRRARPALAGARRRRPGLPERAGARAVPARRGGRHRGGAARRRPVRRRRAGRPAGRRARHRCGERWPWSSPAACSRRTWCCCSSPGRGC